MKAKRTVVLEPLSARRRFLMGGIGFGVAALLPALPASANTGGKIKIGYWPIAGGLPFFVALEKGYFKEAGLDVESVKYASPQQVIEAMIADRVHGAATGTASLSLAVAEIASPNLATIFAANPSNRHHVLDEIIVAANNPIRSIAELEGKKVASAPGIQNVTLARIILEKNGIKSPQVIELPVGQHVPAVAAGQVDAVITLEPIGTIGRLNKTTRVLETGIFAKYGLDNADAPWFGGTASLLNTFIKQSPETAKKFISAYGKGIDFVRKYPGEARQYLNGYTNIEKNLVSEVPLPGFTMYNEFTASDIGFYQKLFDLFVDRGILTRRISVQSMMYKG